GSQYNDRKSGETRAVSPSNNPYPANSALAVAVMANTPIGKRRQAMSGMVEQAASTTQTRLSCTDPGREIRMLPCKRSTSEPTNKAIASAASRRTPGRAAKRRCAVADDDMVLQV